MIEETRHRFSLPSPPACPPIQLRRGSGNPPLCPYTLPSLFNCIFAVLFPPLHSPQAITPHLPFLLLYKSSSFYGLRVLHNVDSSAFLADTVSILVCNCTSPAITRPLCLNFDASCFKKTMIFPDRPQRSHSTPTQPVCHRCPLELSVSECLFGRLGLRRNQ